MLLRVRSIVVSGVAYDLYDFDYGSSVGPIRAGAAVQAGFGTSDSATARGGHVFENVIELTNAKTDDIYVVT